MAKQYLDYAGLKEYDAKIKAWIEALPKDEPVDLSGIEADLANLKELVGNESVDAKINAAIEALVNGAPGSLDTLKEISQWIEEHGEAAANLVESIASLGQKVNEIDTKVDSIGAISLTSIDALFYEPVELQSGQTVQEAINNLSEGQKLVLVEDVPEDLTISKDTIIEAEDVTFSGTITVNKDVNATIIGATFSGEVVIQ